MAKKNEKITITIITIAIIGLSSFMLPSYAQHDYDKPNSISDRITEYSLYMSPLSQLNHGIEPTNVVCNPDLELVIKSSDGKPACVKAESVPTLVEIGWTEGLVSENTILGNIVDANNKFAIDFYSQISKNDSENNIFFSSPSIYHALAMAYEGTDGNTKNEMESVFGFEPNDSKRREGFRKLQGIINPNNTDYILRSANALWLDTDFEPLPEYVNIANTHYDSTVESVDFASEEGTRKINDWVKDKTQGKISMLFDKLPAKTRLVITNAIYFKGIWESQFDTSDTQEADFYVNAQKTARVQMMSVDGVHFSHAKTDTVEIVELPYQGGKFSMLIILPNDASNLRSVEKSITVEKLSKWKDKLDKKRIPVQIPKFSLDTDYDLAEILPEMGVASMFDKNYANFSKMANDYAGLHIGIAVHKASIDVNENGTEAAAATGLGGYVGQYSAFKADHPFVFIIQENETGQILFMGQVIDPTYG